MLPATFDDYTSTVKGLFCGQVYWENRQLMETDVAVRPQISDAMRVGSETTVGMSHRKRGRERRTRPGPLEPTSGDRDDCIMGTNNSSIVSKRSVEKSYFPGDEYFRPFVHKYQRRSPLINRGYWLRMRAIDHTVRRFLQEPTQRHKLVVNLGCGYDPLPFQYLGKHPDLCRNCVFLDVDYPALIRRKVQAIKDSELLQSLLPSFKTGNPNDVELASAVGYRALGCDLRRLDVLERAIRQSFTSINSDIAVLFVAEVSVAYMDIPPADALLKWAASFHSQASFCLLEQHLPEGRQHPFAQTMLKHFQKLRTPLNAIGQIVDMEQRFITAGWPKDGLKIKTLWEVWCDEYIVPPSVKRAMDKVEPFDEWEELALFGAHYFLLVATTSPKSRDFINQSAAKPQFEHGSALRHEYCVIGDKQHPRRFGAGIQLRTDRSSDEVIVHYGGHGVRERLATADLYTQVPTRTGPTIEPMPKALVCHTITACGTLDKPQYLLCGGRTSPDKPSAECWLLEDAKWSKRSDLPRARYRHSAVPVTLPTAYAGGSIPGVIVFGGRSNNSEVLGDFLLWTAGGGWSTLELVGDPPPCPRFSSAMMTLREHADTGYLSGGMNQDGHIMDDLWRWELVLDDEGGPLLEVTKLVTLRGRIGAVMLKHGSQTLLIGGVAAGKLLASNEEILHIERNAPITVNPTNRPLLVGHTAISVPSVRTDGEAELLILGGGATCFSFGTYWNQSCMLRPATLKQREEGWTVQEMCKAQFKSTVPSSLPLRAHDQPRSRTKVARISINTTTNFEELVKRRQPAIISGADIGACTSSWTTGYLITKVGSKREVVVHECPTAHMSFEDRNFKYTKKTFGEFLDAAEQGQHVYMRTVSAHKPLDQPANLAEDYAELAEDFQLPPQFDYVRRNQHSSPLRISGAVSMWLHYDVMANILCQIRGSKKLILFPPGDVMKLDFAPGASSSNLNPFVSSVDDHAGLAAAHAHEAELAPGDILFLPPMWLHAAQPADGLSVAVNVFFRDEDMVASYAAGRDVYGNRDLAAYERGRRDAQRIIASFESIPDDVRRFYLERIAGELLST